MCTWSCRSGPPPRGAATQLDSITLQDLRGYGAADLAFRDGPHLVVGPNAAGKTSLLEAIVLLSWGRSHRTSTDAELIRWGSDVARVEGRTGPETIEVALARSGVGGAGARKRIRVNGVPRRAPALVGLLRTVLFAPEEMLLVVGSPGLRRAAIDQLAAQRSPAYPRDLAAYTRTLQQRNSLLRAIREEQATRDQLRFWDGAFLDSGAAIVEARLRLLGDLAAPLASAHAEIAPEEAAGTGLAIRYATNAPALPGESTRDALARRLVETAEKEVWNGSTLIGPHRDDVVFELGGRDLAGFASRGQQRTAILAFKLAELDLLTAQDGRPPLLLLDDVFSELDPERRSHLVRRIAELPQSFVTTTTLADLDPGLVAAATPWEVLPDTTHGARLVASRLRVP
ncbi:MAG TPA: DNA replication/repair protein RecF [Candidatus Limnocylindrales bacterium]|nr:DNA replication/repair protein RecF [Candidatus Limnocylindrales bacterium]